MLFHADDKRVSKNMTWYSINSVMICMASLKIKKYITIYKRTIRDDNFGGNKLYLCRRVGTFTVTYRRKAIKKLGLYF